MACIIKKPTFTIKINKGGSNTEVVNQGCVPNAKMDLFALFNSFQSGAGLEKMGNIEIGWERLRRFRLGGGGEDWLVIFQLGLGSKERVPELWAFDLVLLT